MEEEVEGNDIEVALMQQHEGGNDDGDDTIVVGHERGGKRNDVGVGFNVAGNGIE